MEWNKRVVTDGTTEIKEVEFEPFGPEWIKEMNYFPKKALINLYAEKCKEFSRLEAKYAYLTGLNSELIDRIYKYREAAADIEEA